MVTEPNVRPVVLSAEQLDQLRRVGNPKSYAAGSEIFVEGDRSEFVVLIDHGKVKVVASEPETGTRSVLALRGAGELIGEFGCIDSAPRSATVIALTMVRAHTISSSHFQQLLNRRSGLLFTLYKIAIARVRESDRRRVEFGAYTPPRPSGSGLARPRGKSRRAG